MSLFSHTKGHIFIENFYMSHGFVMMGHNVSLFLHMSCSRLSPGLNISLFLHMSHDRPPPSGIT